MAAGASPARPARQQHAPTPGQPLLARSSPRRGATANSIASELWGPAPCGTMEAWKARRQRAAPSSSPS